MAIVFDNAASSKGNAATLSFNFAIGGGAGNNRLLVVGVSVVDGEVGIIHYDNRPLNFVGVQVDGNLRTYLYYIWDINLPATAGTYLLQVFGSQGLTSIEAVAVSVSGAAQGAPEATAQSSVASNTSISTAINPITAGAMVFDVVGTLASGISTLTPAAGQTKRDQQDGTTSDVAVSTRSFSSGGPTSVGWSFNAQATKAGHIVAVWAPASGGTQQPGLKDVRTAVTTIVTPASTGNFTVSGVGFKGKAVFLWGVPVQGTAVAVDAAQWLGIADDATPTIHQKSVMVSSRGGVAHNRCAADRQNAISILRADIDAPVVVGNIASWTDDGFVINFTTTTPGYVIFAMVFGGADLKSCVGEAPVGSGTGSVSNLPFSPDVGLTITNDAALGAAPTTTATQALGVFDRNLNQWWLGSFHGIEDTSKKNSLLKTSGFAGQLSRSGSPAVPAVVWEAHLTAVSANGFSWTGNDADGFFFLVLNLGGARAQAGSFAKSTAAAPVTQKLPDPGWKPQAYLLASAVKNDQNPATALGTRVAIGAFSGSRQRSSLRTDPDAGTNADQRASDQRVLGLGDTDAAYTALARALPIADQTPGFEWNPNDNQARLIGFLMLEQGTVSPVQLETPVQLLSAASLPLGTSALRAVDESVVLQMRDSLDLTGYRLEHLTNPAQGKAGGWSLYYQFNEGLVLGTGTLIEVHSSSAEGDPQPRPGRTHRYRTASGQPGQFVLNAANDLLRLVRPDGVESQELPITITNEPPLPHHLVRGDVHNKAGSLVPGVLVEALQLTWTTTGLTETSLGRIITDQRGHYEIVYTPVTGGGTDCGPPPDEVNLVVRALSGDLAQPGTEATRSPVISPAQDEETVDLTVDRAAAAVQAEYSIVDAQFRKCLSQQANDLLQVWLGIRDTPGYLTFAGHATGLPEDKLLAYARANLIARDINQAIPFGGTDPRYAEFGPLPAEVVYALTRSGKGALLSEVLRLDPPQFLAALVDAMDRELIDRVYQTRLAFDAVRSLARQWSLIRAFFFGDASATAVVKTNEATLLALVLTDATRRQAFAARQSEFHGTFADFVAALKQDATITALEAENLLFVFEMYGQTGHLPIVQIVYARKAARGWKTVADLSTVTRRAENGVDGWTEFALLEPGSGGFPGDIFGRTNEEMAASHARRLFELFSKKFSQTLFVDGAAKLGTSGGDPDLQAAVSFIKSNPTFDLVNTPLARFLNETGTSLPEATTTKVLQLQRLRRLTPDFAAATALISAKLDSAIAISRIDESTFIADHEQALGGLLKAQTIHRKAQQFASEVAALLVRFHEELNNTGGSPAMLGSLAVRPALQEVASDVPRFARYAVLFGDLFSCATRQCETVLSPSAYLVDLLQFATGVPRDVLLERRPDISETELSCDNTDKVLPYIDLVIERLSAVIAPWRAHLTGMSAGQLNDAADPSKPEHQTQLDRVLSLVKAGDSGIPNFEAFHFTERALVRTLGPSEWVIEDDAVRWRITPAGAGQFVANGTPQTSKTSELLEVFPEHDNPLAERALGQTVFPFQLPLALGRREVELILRQRGLSRADVLAAFPLSLDPNAEMPDPFALVADAAHARVFLSLTPDEEQALLSKQLPANEYWGFKGIGNESVPRPEAPQIMLSGPWQELLTEVSVFLHRSQLTYAQTLDLLATEFIQSLSQPIVITASDADERECNYNRFHLVRAVGESQTALEPEALQRISFFLRLWRKLGWDMNAVDRYLVLLERTGTVTNRTAPPDLLRLARVIQLAQRLALDPADTFCFYAPLDVRKAERLGPSLFERTLMKGPRSSAGFGLLQDVANNKSPQIKTQDDLESVQANLRTSLGLNRTDFLAIWEKVMPPVPTPAVLLTLTLTDLSTLARTAIFVRAMNLSAADYYRSLAALGIGPFTGADIDAKLLSTAGAVSQLSALASSGLSLSVVEYLLHYPSAGQVQELLPTDATIDDVRRQLAAAARAIEQRYPLIVGADVATLSTFLAEVMPTQQIARVLSELTRPTGAGQALLERYFAVFLAGNTTAFVSGILAPVASDHDPNDPGNDDARRLARVIPLVGAPLRTFLVSRERREQALRLASETVGTTRATTEFLLEHALSSTLPAGGTALTDWKSAVGAFDASLDALSVPFDSLWVAPSDAQVRFVVAFPTGGNLTGMQLAIDGQPLVRDPAITQLSTGESLASFPALDVRAGEVRRFHFEAGLTVRLLVRIGNDDPLPLPLGWFASFEAPSYVKLQKAALLVSGAKLDAVELNELFTEDHALPAAERLLDALPTSLGKPDVSWSRLRLFLDRLALHRNVPLQTSSLFEVLAAGVAPDGQPLNSAEIAQLAGWNALDVSAALTEGIWSSSPSLTKASTWAGLYRAIKIATRLELRVKQVVDLLVKPEPSGAVARTLRESLRAKLTAQDFVSAFKAPRDELRQAHRDALVGYLTTRFMPAGAETRFFVNSNDLFGFFLIDVEMEPDTQISRIKLALNSVQLFIQRVFMGLESHDVLQKLDVKKAQWKWMQNFRVWEANRKVFLYPENWIEPQLRDDKSELFKELEDQLLQDDVDDAHGQTVLATYVDKLLELSQLVIVGLHNFGWRVYHIGRTRSKPFIYYYRTSTRGANGGTYTPWVRMPFEIDSAFVAPHENNGSLRIVWPLVVEKEKVQAGNSESVLGPTAVIRLLWSTLDKSTGKWSKPRLGQAKLFDTQAETVISRNPDQDSIDTAGYHLSAGTTTDGSTQVLVYKTVDPDKVAADKTGAAALVPRFLGWILITPKGDEFAAPQDNLVNLDGFYPAGTVLRNGAAHEVNGIAQIDQLKFFGNTYFARVPAAEPFRMIATDAAYFSDPGQGTFVFEAGGSHLMGDVDTGFAQVGLSTIIVRQAQFETLDHPLMTQIAASFRSDGAPAIMNRLTQALPTSKTRSVYTYHPVGGDRYHPATVYGQSYTYYGGIYLGYYIAGDSMAFGITQRDFQLDFGPDPQTVRRFYPLPTVEFAYGTPFGLYNWELFFHLPMLVADRLAQQLRFEDAIKWLHYVFDPRSDLNEYEKTRSWIDSLPTGARFWNFLPFFANRDVKDSLLDVFGVNAETANPKREQDLKRIIQAWRDNPFSPHLIARQRIAAYQKFTVMKYLDTLIAWGDELFRRDTFETINQATQLYVLAAEILGDRPEVIEHVDKGQRASYRDLAERGLDDFSNALVELESLAVGSTLVVSDDALPPPDARTDSLKSTAFSSLFFRVPRNEKLEGFWDTVADRLFKIRNSLNIDGVKRQLALFEPPIDPGLLVKAQAAGIDLSSALSQLSRPLPHYRFNTWIGQAKELANELKSFSAALLAALEKKDAEALALLRQDQELRLLTKVTEVRKAQLKDAQQNLTSLQERRNLPLDRIQDLSNRKFISPTEGSNMSLTRTASTLDTTAGVMRTIGGVLGLIPQLKVGFISADAEFGGIHLNNIFQAIGDAIGIASGIVRTDASLAGMLGGFERRQEDWNLQIRQAKLELKDLDAQIIGAEIRIDIAQKELDNHELQIEHSQQIQSFLKDKFTNQDLFQWMIGQLSSTYQRVYRLAYDVAKTAERSFAFELGLDSAEFIQFEYRDSLRRGLLSGEKLYFDLKRMEVAYLEQNKREFEITKPISLESINPAALQDLREKGSCEFALPEILFDLDFPGQYFRRIRAVRLTIPAVTGPYTSVSAKLSLLSSAIRVKGTAEPADYAYKGFDDPRFVHDTRGIQSIAVSRAQDDAGVFELNFRDERYLPFEGAGVVSRWRLELPENARQFDYSSISDAVLQLSYTARDAGGSLKQGATAALTTALNRIRHLVSEVTTDTGLSRVFSLKREFPDALHQLLTSQTATLTLVTEHFPQLFRQLGFKLKLADGSDKISVHVQTKASVASGTLNLALGTAPAAAPDAAFTATPLHGFVSGTIVRGTSDLIQGGKEQWTLHATNLTLDNVEDIIFDVRYEVRTP